MTRDTSVAEVVCQLLPGGDARLRAAVAQRWSHTIDDTTGLDEWLRLVQFREPRLAAEIEDRGSDRLVGLRIDPPPLSYRIAPVSGGLARARAILETIVEREWGRAPHRYHWRHEAARRRFTREWDALERAFERAVVNVWCPLACGALAWALRTDVWECITHYAMSNARYPVVGLPDDAVPSGITVYMPHIEARPITPAAHALAERRRAAVAEALARVRPALLAVTPEDVLAYAREAYGPRHRSSWIAVNRASYLLGIAAHAWARQYTPAPDRWSRDALWMASLSLPAHVVGLEAAVEADAEIVAHADRLREAVRERVSTEGASVCQTS